MYTLYMWDCGCYRSLLKNFLQIPTWYIDHVLLFCMNQVCETIEEQLCQSMDSLFTYFVREPLATASVRIFFKVYWQMTMQCLAYYCRK